MKRLLGGLLLAAGILVMTCSGLCSLYIVVAGFDIALKDPTAIFVPLIVGGVPFGLGFGAFKLGRWLLNRSSEEPFE